ncbi:MAG: hypothetical protein AAFO57_07315 [Pseudomonadota bacterium]
MSNKPTKGNTKGARAEPNVDKDIEKAFAVVLDAADPDHLKSLIEKAKMRGREEDDKAKSA